MHMLLWFLGISAGLEACAFLCVCLSARKQYSPRKSDAVIVPGARVMPDGSPSTALTLRLHGAFAMYRKGLAGRIIVCGAKGADEPVRECEVMKRVLVEAGVPADSISEDGESASTIENFRNAARIMRENGLDSCIVVTSDYHLARCLFLAERFGLRASGMRVPGGMRKKTRLMGRMRETISWQLLILKLIFRPSSIK